MVCELIALVREAIADCEADRVAVVWPALTEPMVESRVDVAVLLAAVAVDSEALAPEATVEALSSVEVVVVIEVLALPRAVLAVATDVEAADALVDAETNVDCEATSDVEAEK